MKLYKKGNDAVIAKEGSLFRKPVQDWNTFLNKANLYEAILNDLKDWESLPESEDAMDGKFDPPIGDQEVWAAGVTYQRSKEARMDEAKNSGGDVFYDKVYDADRPELFFKATANRTVGHNEEIYIRRDSDWDVPEPELVLLINSDGKIQGYTIGNDVSSRSIEGENPLYLPQAKTFEKCAALGPCLLVSKEPIDPNTEISISISRDEKEVYTDHVQISKMKRKHLELVDYLFRECEFPHGAFLMTGTCLVPPDDFTLRVGDLVRISIDHIGTLINTVSKKQNKR